MIRIHTNINSVTGSIVQALLDLGNPDGMLRTVATTMAPVVKERIHVQGLAADGTLISSRGYSPGYLAYRQNKYNRTPDRKVILSLTRQMENDWGLQISADGKYGLGYNNSFNADKAAWAEAKYRKKIFALTSGETDTVNLVAQTYVNDRIHAIS